MTFTEEVKAEISRKTPESECCQLAELAALVWINGSIEWRSPERLGLSIRTQNPATARLLFKLLRDVAGTRADVFVRQRQELKKNRIYLVFVPTGARELLETLEIDLASQTLSPRVLVRRCCQRAFLQGAFLAAGEMNNPAHGSYHLQFEVTADQQAEFIKMALRSQGIEAGVSERKNSNSYVVYIKQADQIAALLNMMGALQAQLGLENARVRKEMRNRVNRLVNAETANLEKSLAAAWRQVRMIQFLQGTGQLDRMSVDLRQTARLRLQYPEAPMGELGALHDPPISKSSVHYRLRRLDEKAMHSGFRDIDDA